jgi:hypothetical protein
MKKKYSLRNLLEWSLAIPVDQYKEAQKLINQGKSLDLLLKRIKSNGRKYTKDL